jgi:hypothetical protein
MTIRKLTGADVVELGAIPSLGGKGGSAQSDFGQGIHVCDYTLARRAALGTTRISGAGKALA